MISQAINRKSLAIAAIWAAFFLAHASIIVSDLDANPILDEHHVLQGGLSTAHHKFLRAGGYSHGTFYNLVAGLTHAAVYAGGRLTGAFGDEEEFLAFFFCHQDLFYLLARLITFVIVALGMVALASTLARRIGGLWGSVVVCGFVFTAPALARIGFATPHGAMVGFAALTIAALHQACGRGGRWRWFIAGGVAAASFTTMTIGAGLWFLLFFVALFHNAPDDPPPGRAGRCLFVTLGLLAGILLFGYPILLNPSEYWQSNIMFQLNRQIASSDCQDGQILTVWLLQGLPLWLMGVAGAVWGGFNGRRALAVGALLTALGYLCVPAFLTASRQASYSLAALPCLAYCASGLVPRMKGLKTTGIVLLCVAVFCVPFSFGAAYVAGRMRPDSKAGAGTYMIEHIPEGSVVLVDTWWGPRLSNAALLLAPYGERGRTWMNNGKFSSYLVDHLPREHNKWRIVAYPQDVATLNRESLSTLRIEYIAVSRSIITRPQNRQGWRQIEQDGRVSLLGAIDDNVFFYKVSRSDHAER